MRIDQISFEAASQFLESALDGPARHAVIDELATLTDYREALTRLRTAMRTNTFRFGNSSLNLEKSVKTLDRQTREDGFHALNDWDGKADKLNEDIIPVDLITYFMTATTRPPYPTIGLAIFLDYYFMYVLAMLSLRVWDVPDPSAALDSVSRLLQTLQSPHGSGQRFVANAETLILVATSHFEPDHNAYPLLLEKVRKLESGNRLRIALAHAAILGGHLRFGFEPFYKRDIALMRADNVPDYPWLFFSLISLMREYVAIREREELGEERQRIVEAILNALMPDARAFLGKPPAALAAYEAEVAEFQSLFRSYGKDLLAEFEEIRPSNQEYSALAFNFNFPHNIVKAIVVNAVARGESTFITLNDLLTGVPRQPDATRAKYATMTRLMEYARTSPEIIRGRAFPMVVYDPLLALRNYTKTLTLIREFAA